MLWNHRKSKIYHKSDPPPHHFLFGFGRIGKPTLATTGGVTSPLGVATSPIIFLFQNKRNSFQLPL